MKLDLLEEIWSLTLEIDLLKKNDIRDNESVGALAEGGMMT